MMYNQLNQQMYPQPYGQTMNQMGQGNMPRKTDIIHVNGQNGAQAFQMMPNSQALLLDDTAPIVWLAQTDGAGYKTVTPFSITPYQPEPEINIKEIDQRLRNLEEMMQNVRPDEKSNASSSKSTASSKSK